MLGHVGTSRLIGSGPIRPPFRPSKGQSDVLHAIDHSVTRSMTAQPPGIRPSTLRVTTHGQQVASLGGGLTPLQRCSRRILQPQPTVRLRERGFLSGNDVHNKLKSMVLVNSEVNKRRYYLFRYFSSGGV